MFGRKKGPEPPALSERYVVETLNLSATFKPEKRARVIQDALNLGDAKGWKLVTMEDQGQWHVRIIVWDTSPV